MKICWAQYLLWLVIAVLGTGSALSACGQKGALYQPEPSAHKEPSAHNMPAAQKVPSMINEPSANKEPSP
jgi:predicted small lipoprotein YifL